MRLRAGADQLLHHPKGEQESKPANWHQDRWTRFCGADHGEAKDYLPW